MKIQSSICAIAIFFGISAFNFSMASISEITYLGTDTWVGGGTVRGMDVDSNDNVYITGSFSGTSDLDPGEGTDFHTSLGSNDAFITRINSDGNYAWSITFGGIYGDMITDIAADSSGNIYVAGIFGHRVDFDPGAGSYSVRAYSSSGRSIFVSKFDSNGSFLWSRAISGQYHVDLNALYVDSEDRVHLGGRYSGFVYFNYPARTDYTSIHSRGGYVSTFNADGSYVGTLRLGSQYGSLVSAIAVTDTGEKIIAGEFRETMDLDPGPGSTLVHDAYGIGVYIVKLDTNNSLIWGGTMDGPVTNPMGISKIVIDQQDDLYLGGFHENNSDLDPGNGVALAQSQGSRDLFVVKLSGQDGSYQWHNTSGHYKWDKFFDLIIDNRGNTFLSGQRGDGSNWDRGTGQAAITQFNADGTLGQLLRGGSDAYMVGPRFLSDQQTLLYVGRFINQIGTDMDPTAGFDFHKTSAVPPANLKGYLTRLQVINNIAPIANAGEDDFTYLGASYQFTGTATDADNDPLTFHWQIANSPIGSPPLLLDANTATPTLIPSEIGTYTLSLKVHDGSTYSVADSVILEVMTPDGALTEVSETLLDQVELLPEGDLSDSTRANPLSGKLNELMALMALDEPDYLSAHALVKDLLPRLDGCDERGSADVKKPGKSPTADWVINCDEQIPLYHGLKLIEEIILANL